ncbi:hypothetical protein LTR37_019655 [Vermiconidia calcicola]|uniref:Uncharacterized protein n=1 Tax=Vermiconidia calcicola TaxID=1690605 RepID=A0ACC3MGI9_9PEZI|nr:hypothetical protein LTR37_019655 [Vermiconidia calcicola]
MATGPTLLHPDDPECTAILDSIVNLHASCILNDHTVATFIPPLSQEQMHQRWMHLLKETTSGLRIIIVYISNVEDRNESLHDVVLPFGAIEWPQISPGKEVSGTASLSLPKTETGPFRGLVQNLFVSPHYRRRGIASKLLAELERQALRHDRWNLMLDTTQGTDAEILYTNLRWERLGVVKNYGLSPQDGRFLDGVFFWKDIRSAEHK